MDLPINTLSSLKSSKEKNLLYKNKICKVLSYFKKKNLIELVEKLKIIPLNLNLLFLRDQAKDLSFSSCYFFSMIELDSRLLMCNLSFSLEQTSP